MALASALQTHPLRGDGGVTAGSRKPRLSLPPYWGTCRWVVLYHSGYFHRCQGLGKRVVGSSCVLVSTGEVRAGKEGVLLGLLREEESFALWGSGACAELTRIPLFPQGWKRSVWTRSIWRCWGRGAPFKVLSFRRHRVRNEAGRSQLEGQGESKVSLSPASHGWQRNCQETVCGQDQ